MSDFVRGLERLIRSHGIFGLLRRCHLPCQRLISFEDFCQDVFLRAIQKQEKYEGRSDAELGGWLRAIGNQRMIDTLRRSRRERTVPLEMDVAAPGVSADPALSQERILWLLRVLASLPKEDQDLLLRRYWKRDSWQKIGADLGLPPNTLAQRHLRLLRLMRAMAEVDFREEKVS